MIKLLVTLSASLTSFCARSMRSSTSCCITILAASENSFRPRVELCRIPLNSSATPCQPCSALATRTRCTRATGSTSSHIPEYVSRKALAVTPAFDVFKKASHN
eukprot:6459871-Amphidinium_carterae.1